MLSAKLFVTSILNNFDYLFFSAGLPLALCLSTPEVSVVGKQQYLNLQEPIRRALQCSFSLDEGEQLSKVIWSRNDEVVLTWTAGDPPSATGNLISKRDQYQKFSIK